MHKPDHNPPPPGPLTGLISALLDQAGLGLAAMDASGRLTVLNDSLADMLGHPYEPATHTELPAFYPLYTETGLRKLGAEEYPLVRAWYGEHVTNAHLLVKRPQQAPRHLRAHALPTPEPAGARRGALVLVEDITHARDGSATFAELRDVLVTSLNHELRTPLSTILGHTELLEDTTDLPQPVSKSLQAIQRAGRRLASVANDVTALAAHHTARHNAVNVRTIELPNNDPDSTTYRPTRYTIHPAGWTRVADDRRRDWRITVEDAGDGWAVRWRSRCLNYRYEWEFEPRSRSRTDDFLKRCRFSERAALNRARRAVDELVVDGMTFAEFIIHVQDEAAAKARAALTNGVSGTPADTQHTHPVLPLHQRLHRKLGRHP